jgi:GT2 family glycosyltransferase
LESVKRQNYPKDKIEIIVIDNGSKDASVKVAREFTKKVWIDNSREGYSMRANGMRRAMGEYVYMILEQDMELKEKDFLQRLVLPLIEDKRLIASFARECPRSDQPWISRYVTYDSSQRDPIIRYFTPSVEDTIIENKRSYYVCSFEEGKVPPSTHFLFRKSYLKKSKIWNQVQDFDHDTVLNIIKAGYSFFAFVPSAGLYHHHAKSLKHFIEKRIRNLNNHFFPYHNHTGFKYIFSPFDVIKLIFWIIYANLFIPAAVVGIFRYFKHKDKALLMEPIVTICLTNALIWNFISSPQGRKTIVDLVADVFRSKKLVGV